MSAEDRYIGQQHQPTGATDRVVGLEHRMDALREEFMRVQSDGHLSTAERNAALEALRAEIQRTFAGLHGATG
jgi:uncharacterized small protein (DUF1192 family)